MLHALTDFRWSGAGHNLPASMPGRLHDALLASGILGDVTREAPGARGRARRRIARSASNPARGFQSRAAEWAALREWVLIANASFAKLDAERIFLCAQGVRGHGMLRIGNVDVAPFSEGDWEIEITAQVVNQSEATIALVFAPGLPQGTPPAVRVGIDGGLFLRCINQLRLINWQVTPRIVDGYGLVESQTTVSPYIPGRYIFRYAAMFGDETLAVEEITERLFAVQTTFTHRIVLPLPKWWRFGQENEQVLLRLNITRAGLVCDDWMLATGFREISFMESPDTQLIIDGSRILMIGAEWAGAAEALLPAEEIDRRLSLLRTAHINCLRVYGAEMDPFYDSLDQKGFLFWQVLPLAEQEALSLIKRVRHRPGLIAYACESVYVAPNRPADSFHPKIRAIGELVRAHDGSHPFFGPIPGGLLAEPGIEDLGAGICKDVLGPMAFPGPAALCQQMNRDDAPIRTVGCAAPALDLAELAGGETYWPPDTALWAHRNSRAFDLPAFLQWFDPDLEDPVRIVLLSRAMQAETLRYAVERARMRSDYASGIFVQDLFERTPSLFSSALFDETIARPAYWALESALRPLHVCARLESMTYPCGASLEAYICLLCDTLVMGLLTVRAQLFMPDGSILAEVSYDAKPETAELGAIAATLPGSPCALLLRVTADRFGEVLDINDYVLCVSQHGRLEALLSAPRASVFFDHETLRNEGNHIALGVSGVAWSDPQYPGWGAMLPGETRPVMQENAFEGLNIEPVG